MVKFGKWTNNFYWRDVIKIIISVGKEKVQFTTAVIAGNDHFQQKTITQKSKASIARNVTFGEW